jgi:hypothetical protein
MLMDVRFRVAVDGMSGRDGGAVSPLHWSVVADMADVAAVADAHRESTLEWRSEASGSLLCTNLEIASSTCRSFQPKNK